MYPIKKKENRRIIGGITALMLAAASLQPMAEIFAQENVSLTDEQKEQAVDSAMQAKDELAEATETGTTDIAFMENSLSEEELFTNIQSSEAAEESEVGLEEESDEMESDGSVMENTDKDCGSAADICLTTDESSYIYNEETSQIYTSEQSSEAADDTESISDTEEDAEQVTVYESRELSDRIKEELLFDYDAADDAQIVQYLSGLNEEELAGLVGLMNEQQYERYIFIMKTIDEMQQKSFENESVDEECTPDRSFDYASFDEYAEKMSGVSLQRTDEQLQFFNTYIDKSYICEDTTIDELLDSNADWYSEEYILNLNPEQFKETTPIYYGADGNYYAVSAVPFLNSMEPADYQPATSFYNGEFAQAFTDITYLGNGVYCIPSERYQYCFTEQYYSDAGALRAVSYGLRIQVLYGFDTASDHIITVAADVVYPDLTERLITAELDFYAGTAALKVFDSESSDSLDNYYITASINRGEALPYNMSVVDSGHGLSFDVEDARAVGCIDVLIGCSVESEYSMQADVSTADLFGVDADDGAAMLTAELYNDNYLLLDKSSIPQNLAVGDKFIVKDVGMTITGVNDAVDKSGTTHIGAVNIPTHNAQSLVLYNATDSVCDTLRSWFVNSLADAASPDPDTVLPGIMVQMNAANIKKSASNNGHSRALGDQKIFGYTSDPLEIVTSTNGKTINLEGTRVILSCMHAWYNEIRTPEDIKNSINSFTERNNGQSEYAADIGDGHYKPNLAMQCTSVKSAEDGFTYATFKVISSMLGVGGFSHPFNYQCAFATLRIVWETPEKGYSRSGISVQKLDKATGTNIASGNASLADIKFAVINSEGLVECVIATDEQGLAATEADALPAGRYTIKELRMDAFVKDGILNEGVSMLANTSYIWSDTSTTVDITDADDGKIVLASGVFANEPLTAVPKIIKQDYELACSESMAGTDFAGITFSIINESENAVVIDGASIEPGQTAATAVSDELGNILFNTALPLGRYSVVESNSNAYYNTDKNVKFFRIENENDSSIIVYEDGGDCIIFKNTVVRSDICLVKKSAATAEGISGVPFKIENQTTGETHFIVTGPDGGYNSETFTNSCNTNANDTVLAQYGSTDIIPQEVINELIRDAGLWFGQGRDGTAAPINDELASLPYGTYTLTELKTEATKSMKMYSKTFLVDSDGVIIDFGEVLNHEMSIGTTLLSDENAHIAKAEDNIKLTDYVEYKNLDTEKEYTLEGTLYLKSGEGLLELDEQYVNFKPEMSEGIATVCFLIDAAELAGKSVVAFEVLTQDGEFCAEHKDENDEAQSVSFPSLPEETPEETTVTETQTSEETQTEKETQPPKETQTEKETPPPKETQTEERTQTAEESETIPETEMIDEGKTMYEEVPPVVTGDESSPMPYIIAFILPLLGIVLTLAALKYYDRA